MHISTQVKRIQGSRNIETQDRPTSVFFKFQENCRDFRNVLCPFSSYISE